MAIPTPLALSTTITSKKIYQVEQKIIKSLSSNYNPENPTATILVPTGDDNLTKDQMRQLSTSFQEAGWSFDYNQEVYKLSAVVNFS